MAHPETGQNTRIEDTKLIDRSNEDVIIEVASRILQGDEFSLQHRDALFSTRLNEGRYVLLQGDAVSSALNDGSINVQTLSGSLDLRLRLIAKLG